MRLGLQLDAAPRHAPAGAIGPDPVVVPPTEVEPNPPVVVDPDPVVPTEPVTPTPVPAAPVPLPKPSIEARHTYLKSLATAGNWMALKAIAQSYGIAKPLAGWAAAVRPILIAEYGLAAVVALLGA